MNNVNTLDKLGYREIDQLGDLLKKYADNPDDCGLNDGVNWEYNPNSDNLFLVDSDYNVAMVNDETGKLGQFITCPNCGQGGFKDSMEVMGKDGKCVKCNESMN